MRREWSALKKLIFLKGSVLSGGWTMETVQGAAPVTLTNAVAKPITELTVYGKCAVSNGEIFINVGKMTKADTELPEEYKRVIGFTFSNNCYFTIPYNLAGFKTVRFTMKPNGACNVFGSYTTAQASNNYSLYLTSTTSGKYLRYNGGTYASGFSASDFGVEYNVEITPTGSTGLPRNDTWTEQTFECETDMYIGTTSPSSTSSKFNGDLIGVFEVEGSAYLIPCERIADGVLGYFDAYNYEFYEPTVGTPTSLGYDEVTGYSTSYENSGGGTIRIGGTNAVNTPDLYAVGDVKDEYNHITGVLTRRCDCGVVGWDDSEPVTDYITDTGDWEAGAIYVKVADTPYSENWGTHTLTPPAGNPAVIIDEDTVYGNTTDNVIKVTYAKGS